MPANTSVVRRYPYATWIDYSGGFPVGGGPLMKFPDPVQVSQVILGSGLKVITDWIWESIHHPRYWSSTAATVILRYGELDPAFAPWKHSWEVLPDQNPGEGDITVVSNQELSIAFDPGLLLDTFYVQTSFKYMALGDEAEGTLDGVEVHVTWAKNDKAAFVSSPVPVRRFGGLRKRSTSRPAALFLK